MIWPSVINHYKLEVQNMLVKLSPINFFLLRPTQNLKSSLTTPSEKNIN